MFCKKKRLYCLPYLQYYSPQGADNELSEEDSADKYCTEFDLDNLGQKLLYAEAEAYRQAAALLVNRK